MNITYHCHSRKSEGIRTDSALLKTENPAGAASSCAFLSGCVRRDNLQKEAIYRNEGTLLLNHRRIGKKIHKKNRCTRKKVSNTDSIPSVWSNNPSHSLTARLKKRLRSKELLAFFGRNPRTCPTAPGKPHIIRHQ